MRFATANPAYEDSRTALLGMPGYPTPEMIEAFAGEPSTDDSPEVAAQALLAFLEEPNPPLRKMIGTGAQAMVQAALDARRADYCQDPAFTWPS